MKKLVFTFLGLMPLGLHAEKLRLLNKYSNPIKITVYNKNSNSPQEFRIDSNTPRGVLVGDLAQIDHIDIKPYGDYKQYTQWGIKQIDLTEAQKLATQNANQTIVITINASNPTGGWLGGLGSQWGTWNYKTTLEQPQQAALTDSIKLNNVFPAAVAAAKAGQPIYTRYVLNFPKDVIPSEAEITKRYRQLMLEFHPDKTHSQALSNQIAQILNAAKEAGPNGTLSASLFKEDETSDLESGFISLDK